MLTLLVYVVNDFLMLFWTVEGHGDGLLLLRSVCVVGDSQALSRTVCVLGDAPSVIMVCASRHRRQFEMGCGTIDMLGNNVVGWGLNDFQIIS